MHAQCKIKQQQQNQFIKENHISMSSPISFLQLPSTFYQDVSQIIKLFRKQLSLHIKYQSLSNYQQNQFVKEIFDKKQQGLVITVTYKDLLLVQSYYSTIQRVIGRIKEIVQFTSNIQPNLIYFITNELRKLEIKIYKSIGVISLQEILNGVLVLIPKFYQNKTLSPQKKLLKKLSNKQNINITKKTNTLNLILQGYKKSFNLLSILDIDQQEYRSLFFTARDDRFKNTLILQDDMRYRNRFIKSQMNLYDLKYFGYQQRAKKNRYISTRKKSLQPKRSNLLRQSQHRNSEYQTIQTQNVESCIESISPVSFYTKQRKADNSLKTYNQKASNLLSTVYNFNKGCHRQQYRTTGNIYYKTANKSRSKHCIQLDNINIKQKDQLYDSELQNKIKGQFRMTKVLFGKNGKLELSPHLDIKQSGISLTSQSMKNKIIFRKVQQKIKKRLARISTQPQPSATQLQVPNKLTLQQKLLIPPSQHQVVTSITNFNGYMVHPNKSKKFTWKDKEIKFLGVRGLAKQDKRTNNHKNLFSTAGFALS